MAEMGYNLLKFLLVYNRLKIKIIALKGGGLVATSNFTTR